MTEEKETRPLRLVTGLTNIATFVKTTIALLLLLNLLGLLSGVVMAYDESFKGELKLVKKLDPDEMMAYFGLQYLLNDYQKKQFLSLKSRPEREKWIEQFWAEQDPTPGTEINEKRIEHEKRVKLARKLFGIKKPPGWDRRGEVLIRFGFPTTRERIWADINFHGMTPPGEVWYYKKLNMIVAFQNYNLKGEYIFAITPYGRSATRELERVKNVIDLLKNHVLQPIYPLQYMDYDEIKDLVDYNPDEIDYLGDRDILAETPKDLIAQIEEEKKEEAINNFYKYMEEKPTIYSYELKEKPLPLYFDITTFHGGGNKLRIEVNFEVPTEELRLVRSKGTLSGEVELNVVVRDMEMNEIARGRDYIRVRFAEEKTSKGPSLLPGKVTLTLEPGYYRFGLQATDKNSNRVGGYRTSVLISPIKGAPYISDILFASSITESEYGEKFQKGNLYVVPHPMHAYMKPKPIKFYFEIYNLKTDADGIAYYRIEYKIIPKSKRRKGPVLEEVPSVISSSFETSGYGSTQIQHLSISTENLWEGIFELSIKVTDRITFQKFERKTRFSILEQ